MKRMFVFIVLSAVILFLLECCTTFNISPKLLINKSQYIQFPELSDGLEWGTFKMERVSETVNVNVRYFPENNFFMVNNYQGEVFNPIKIDHLGKTIFQLHLPKSDAFHLIDDNNSFIIGENSVYNFAEDHPTAVSFSTILNKENTLTSEEWIQIFESHYQKAEIVLYGWVTDLESANCVYFQTAGKWTKLYTFSHSGPSFIYSQGSKIKCKIKKKEVPEKVREVHFLKDVARESYSNEHRFTDSYSTPFNTDQSFFPDQSLHYKMAGAINMLAFSKENSSSDGYNIGIPTLFYGTAFYEMNFDGAVLHFKNNAIKSVGIGEKVQSETYIFALPEKFLNRSKVSFLTYDYGINKHKNGKEGVYVIRRKGN